MRHPCMVAPPTPKLEVQKEDERRVYHRLDGRKGFTEGSMRGEGQPEVQDGGEMEGSSALFCV